jgi:hypothetical protein
MVALVRTLSSQLQSNEELLLLHRWSTSHLGLFIGASLFLYLRRGGVQAVCCAHAGHAGPVRLDILIILTNGQRTDTPVLAFAEQSDTWKEKELCEIKTGNRRAGCEDERRRRVREYLGNIIS